jgi:PKD repeat protein
MVDYLYETDESNIKTIDFTDISTNYPTSWAWDFGDGNNSTDQNPTHTYQNVGIYEVVLTVTNEQGDYTEEKCINVGNVSISEEEVKETVKVFPNPVSGNSINVQLNSIENGEIQYSLINAEGKLLDNGSINAVSNSTIKIPLHNYSSGVYTLKIVQDSKIYIKQITIL